MASPSRRFYSVLLPPLRPWEFDDGWGDKDTPPPLISRSYDYASDHNHISCDDDYSFAINNHHYEYDYVIASFIQTRPYLLHDIIHIDCDNDVPPSADDYSGDEYNDDDGSMTPLIPRPPDDD